MPRYGAEEFLYGQWLYGHEDYNKNLLWIVNIDWNDDGRLDGYNEAMRCIDMQTRSGRKAPVMSIGGGFQHGGAGEAKVVLDNSDGRYDPYDPNALYYGNLEPGKLIALGVRNGYDGTNEYIFSGKIADISVSEYGNGQRTCTLTCRDGWDFLNNKRINIPVTAGLTTGQAIALILTTAGWPSVWGTEIDDGSDTIPYFWVNDKTATEAINEICDSEFGTVFLKGDGTFVFLQRSHVPTITMSLTQEDLLKNIEIPQPWLAVRNLIEVKVYPQVLVEDETIYTMQDVVQVDPGETVTIWGEASYSNRKVGVVNVDNPVFTANAQDDGLGADMTADFSCSAEAYGSKIKNTITNTDAVDIGFVTSYTVDGDVVDCPDKSSVIEDDSGTDEEKAFVLDTPWQTSLLLSKSYAHFLAGALNEKTKFPIFSLEDKPSIQFGIELFDTFSLSIEKLGVEAQDFRVCYIEHKWLSDTGQAVRTKIYTEKNLSGGTIGTNLITNHDFETGDLTGWTQSNTEFSVVETEPFEGDYCLEVAPIAGASETLDSDRYAALDEQTYEIILYTREYILPDDDQTVVCPVTEVCYISSQNPTTNYHNLNVCGGNGSYKYRPLYKFDLSGIPAGVTIKTALFYNNLTGVNSTIATQLCLYRALAAWADDTVTYNTKPDTEDQAIGAVNLAKNEAAGWKALNISQFYLQEMITDGSWTDNGLALRAAPEGGSTVRVPATTVTRTVWVWETYISGYFTTRMWDDVDDKYYYIQRPIYSQQLVPKQVTETTAAIPSSPITNIYTFSDAPYLSVVYDATIYPNPDYKVEIRWYDDPVAGSLLRTDVVCTENQSVDWCMRKLQINSPTDAESYDVLITAIQNDAKFWVDKISVKPIGYY